MRLFWQLNIVNWLEKESTIHHEKRTKPPFFTCPIPSDIKLTTRHRTTSLKPEQYCKLQAVLHGSGVACALTRTTVLTKTERNKNATIDYFVPSRLIIIVFIATFGAACRKLIFLMTQLTTRKNWYLWTTKWINWFNERDEFKECIL